MNIEYGRTVTATDGLQTIEAPPSRLKATVGKLERCGDRMGSWDNGTQRPGSTGVHLVNQ